MPQLPTFYSYKKCFNNKIYQAGEPSHTHTWMEIWNQSTSAKPVMTKLQHLFVALTSKYGYLSDDTKIKFINYGLLE